MTQSLPPQIWPALQANDAAALIDFLQAAFGFEANAVYRDGDTVAHAELLWPEGGGVMLGQYDPSREYTRQPGTAGCYVVTDRVDDVHARAVGAGATITREPSDPPYGGREFTAADPEGNLWSFGSYRGEPRRDLPVGDHRP
jgi:uncharacterized glyoxalase superfamily protein PhnB